LFFKKGTGQLEALMFIRAGIEVLLTLRPCALGLGGIVYGKSSPLVYCARMRERMSAAGLIDMEADHLAAKGTLCGERVRPPPAEELK
jgi:hypothetical protein